MAGSADPGKNAEMLQEYLLEEREKKYGWDDETRKTLLSGERFTVRFNIDTGALNL